MKHPKAFLATGLILLSPFWAFADEARRIQQEMTRDPFTHERTPEEQEPLLFEDPEFGEQLILRRMPPPPLVTVFADAAPAYSSNPLLLADEPEDDFLITGTLGVTLQPDIIREWEPALSAEIFAQYQVFRYDDFSALDFDSMAAGFTARYVLPRNFTAYGGWAGSRLVDRDDRDSFYEESQVTLGINTVVPEDQTFAVFAGFQTDVRNTSPGSLSRLDNGPYAGVRLFLHPDVSLRFRYRFAHQHYWKNGRDDLNSSFNTSFAWELSEHLALRVRGAYVVNQSNRAENEYDLATARTGATLTYSF